MCSHNMVQACAKSTQLKHLQENIYHNIMLAMLKTMHETFNGTIDTIRMTMLVLSCLNTNKTKHPFRPFLIHRISKHRTRYRNMNWIRLQVQNCKGKLPSKECKN